MNRIALTAAAILLAGMIPAFPQDAKLIILDDKDTVELKEAYSAYQSSLQKWEQAKLKVASAYTVNSAKKMFPCKVSLGVDDLDRTLVRRVNGIGPRGASSTLSVSMDDQKLPDCKIMDGWSRVEFSVDFRAVVPDESRYYSSGFLSPVSASYVTNAAASAITLGSLSVDVAKASTAGPYSPAITGSGNIVFSDGADGTDKKTINPPVHIKAYVDCKPEKGMDCADPVKK